MRLWAQQLPPPRGCPGALGVSPGAREPAEVGGAGRRPTARPAAAPCPGQGGRGAGARGTGRGGVWAAVIRDGGEGGRSCPGVRARGTQQSRGYKPVMWLRFTGWLCPQQRRVRLLWQAIPGAAMSEAVDLSFLSEAERDLILQVLQRDEELRKAEERRIR